MDKGDLTSLWDAEKHILATFGKAALLNVVSRPRSPKTGMICKLHRPTRRSTRKTGRDRTQNARWIIRDAKIAWCPCESKMTMLGRSL